LLPKIPYKGLCVDCGEERWIVLRKPPLCDFCNKIRKAKNKPPKELKRAPIKYKKKPQEFKVKESDVFREIWEEKERVSYVTGKKLPDTEDARSYYFSHVLPKGKGKYPMFKYYKKNIVFKTFEEHELWENHKYKLRKLPQWKHVFASSTEPVKLHFSGLVSKCCDAKVYPNGGRFKCLKCENKTEVKRV
jgi:hypothetical protein